MLFTLSSDIFLHLPRLAFFCDARGDEWEEKARKDSYLEAVRVLLYVSHRYVSSVAHTCQWIAFVFIYHIGAQHSKERQYIQFSSHSQIHTIWVKHIWNQCASPQWLTLKFVLTLFAISNKCPEGIVVIYQVAVHYGLYLAMSGTYCRYTLQSQVIVVQHQFHRWVHSNLT